MLSIMVLTLMTTIGMLAMKNIKAGRIGDKEMVFIKSSAKFLISTLAFFILISSISLPAHATCTSTISNSSPLSTTTISSAADGQCLANTGIITTAGNGINGVNNLLNISNSGTIAESGGGNGIYLDSSNSIITNSGSITGSDSGNQVYGIWFDSGSSSTLTNSGNISISNANDRAYGIAIYSGVSSLSFTNSGSISVSGATNEFGVFVRGGIDSFINSGSITANSVGAHGIDVYTPATISNLTNAGSISVSGTSSFGIYNPNGAIGTLNNAQGGNSSNASTTALTFSGNLPTNYNIIVRSPSYYGQLAITNPSGVTNFGIYTGGVDGVPASTVTKGTYVSVLSGLTTSNIGATRSGTYNGLNWTLTLQNGSSSIWDLIFSGGSTVDTQSSLHALAPKLRSVFSSQAIATNFANMNTYDCDLFDEKGVCVSVGGQQTYVDNPSSNMTSTVVVAGYRVSPTFRIGGFLNQNINNNSVSGVHMSNANPLMGLFAVWNQNEDHLGYQVKVANAYQDKDVSTTRDIIGTSEAGTGSTNLNTQSYVGELSYTFLANEDKTLVRPYAAVRYTRIKQDGYTEQTTSTVTAPLTYASLEDRSTSALVGVKLDHKLADKFHLKGSLGIEQDLYHHVDNLSATGVDGLTSENFNDNIKRTRPVASIGAYFSPAKNQRIAGDIYYQQLPFQSTASTTAYVNYMIGF